MSNAPARVNGIIESCGNNCAAAAWKLVFTQNELERNRERAEKAVEAAKNLLIELEIERARK